MSLEQFTDRAIRAASRLYEVRPRVALDYLLDALEVDPVCYEALVMAGDLWSMQCDEWGVDRDQGYEQALPFYDRAIAARPDLAEAHAEKSRTLKSLGRFEEALTSVEQGFAVLELWPNTDVPPDVWTNIAETLYVTKAVCLLELTGEPAGRQALLEGLGRFPESWYLTSYLDDFLPAIEPTPVEEDPAGEAEPAE